MYKAVKSVGKVIGAVVLGTLGSALWDLVKPWFVKIGNWVTETMSQWVTGYSDGLYQEIARSPSEGRAEAAFGLILLLFALSLMLYAAYLLGGGAKKDVQIDERSLFHPKRRPTLFSRIIAVFSVTIIISMSRMTYKESAIRKFNYVLAVNRPALTEKENLEILSKFAQIQSKADYDELLNELYAFGNKHVPQLDWSYPGRRIPSSR